MRRPRADCDADGAWLDREALTVPTMNVYARRTRASMKYVGFVPPEYLQSLHKRKRKGATSV